MLVFRLETLILSWWNWKKLTFGSSEKDSLWTTRDPCFRKQHLERCCIKRRSWEEIKAMGKHESRRCWERILLVACRRHLPPTGNLECGVFLQRSGLDANWGKQARVQKRKYPAGFNSLRDNSYQRRHYLAGDLQEVFACLKPQGTPSCHRWDMSSMIILVSDDNCCWPTRVIW